VAVGAIEAQVLKPGSTIGSCISRYCSSTGPCCKVWDAKSRFRQRIRWIPQRAAVSWSTPFRLCASCWFTHEADGSPLAKFLLISLYKRRKKNGARSSMAQTLALLLFCNQISCMSTLCILPGWQHCSNPYRKITLQPYRGTFVKGSTAVMPAPILHEFQDGSTRNAPIEQSGCVRATANSQGVLEVRQMQAHRFQHI
jgi:hypothetical protein